VADEPGKMPDFEDLDLPGDDLTAPLSDELPPGEAVIAPPAPPGAHAEPEERGRRATLRAAGATAKPPWKQRAIRRLKLLPRSNPYTVLLATALVALLIGIFCLLLELGRYGFSTGPSSGRPRASLAPPAVAAPAPPTATA
jgi:hypothetical protein